MWETFISWYINNYLGKYVENLNSQQLSFALRQGELELENVPLKKNIFRSWGLPIEVRSGIVGRIKIEFNLLKYFRNEPVLVSIENVYLVASPLNLSEWDPVEEAALAHENKMNALDSHEGRWKAQFDLASNSYSNYSSLYFSSMQIGASIVTKVVENLQLNVHNVHIRFEDEAGISNYTVAFGITLKSLTAQSCDSAWNPLSTSPTGNTTDCSFKTLQLTEFGIYCDSRTEKFSGVNPVDLITEMNKCSTNHDYLLCPVSAEARITKNNSSHPLSSSSRPRFDVQLSLEKVPLQLSDSQFRTTFHSYKSFSRLYRNCRLRHYRPFVESVKEAPILWWKYAVQAILAYRGYKQRTVLKNWDEILQRANDNITFVKAYEQHLRRELISSHLRKVKDRMESELHYEEIVALREVAMRRVEQRSERPELDLAAKEQILTFSSTFQISSSASTSSTGIFSYIFPSWSNWLYSADSIALATTEPTKATTTEELENEIIQLRKSESELDELIMDDVKSFGRDALLARFKFILKKGVIALNRKSGRFMEMDFYDVDIATELRPKSGAHKFHVTLASLLLRDGTTKSLLVSPHSNQYGKSFEKENEIPVEPIFQLFYDRKPSKRAGHRISLTTKPMDLVIHPVLWKDVTSFFSCSDVEDYLEIPQNRYEVMKEKTKQEIRTYWETLIYSKSNSVNGGIHSNWEISLDIAAPQIVVHSSQQSMIAEPSILSRRFHAGSRKEGVSARKFIVFNLGRFRFTNSAVEEIEDNADLEDSTNEGTEATEDSDDGNEEFLTPCSSPVPENVSFRRDSESPSSQPSVLESEQSAQIEHGTGIDFANSLGELQAKLSKKYKLEITDIQIIVVIGKYSSDGSWKIGNSRGSSMLHLVDRFSINLEFERRLVKSEDPEWPAVTVMATLPKLNLHLNKAKIHALQNVLKSYFGNGMTGADNISTSNLTGSNTNLNESSIHLFRPADKPRLHIRSNAESNNCKLFLAQFTIRNFTVEIQSNGRSIAELQISGVRTTLTKWRKHTSISFVIHSLLLADAVQTFGTDFELLLASHKSVCVDSVSGSLIDSDPTSPQSPSSPLPFSPRNLGGELYKQAIPSELHSALLSSLLSKESYQSSYSEKEAGSPTYDSDALITAELMLVHSDLEDVAIISVLFNNLDVIANQETFIEILQFVQDVAPPEETSRRTRTESGSALPLISNTDNWKIEASFEFSRLNVLLHRGVVGKDGCRKVATATACNARVGFSLGDSILKIDGSLGGLQMLNLTPEGKYHQRVLSVGTDPIIDYIYPVFSKGPNPFYVPLENGANDAALEFMFEKSTVDDSDFRPTCRMQMASVVYTHCPVFLIDLKECISQFQVPLATKLKSAVAQIALGLVKQDSILGNNLDSRSGLSKFSISLDKLNEEDRGDGGSLLKSNMDALTQNLSPLEPGKKEWNRFVQRPRLTRGQSFRLDNESLKKLMAMGFPHSDCCEALEHCEGRLEEAALLLSSPGDISINSSDFKSLEPVETRNSTPDSLKLNNGGSSWKCGTGSLDVACEIELKCMNLCISVVDCKDAGVPLFELTVSGLELVKNLKSRTTTVQAVLSGDYYNRELYGWEPFLEPWKFSLTMQQNEQGQLREYSPSTEFPKKAPEMEFFLTSREIMNINFTSTLLSLYNKVSSDWSNGYGHQDDDKERAPFVPFVLRNETGSTLWFSTIITDHDEVLKQHKGVKIDSSHLTDWIQVKKGASQTFSFDGRGKLRHQSRHKFNMHQVVVRVQGWFDSSPVSVDRVGTYFRDITPVCNIPKRYGAEMAELPTTRLVFEISLQGSAQKLVRVRSALMVKNTLNQTVELKLENTIIYPALEMAQTGGGSYCIYIKPHETSPIPLHSVCSQIWIRPIISNEFQLAVYSYCSKPLPMGRDLEGIRTCASLASNEIQPYRFCVAVKRDEFPIDTDQLRDVNKSLSLAIGLAKRANLITISSPLTIMNLLPYDVSYEIKNHSSGGILQSGRIAVGKKACITNVDTSEAQEVSFRIEDFLQCSSVSISTNSPSFVGRLKLLDTQKRPLHLNARVIRGDGGTITVRLTCPYWIVNKTGLPLLVKQDGTSNESAGQFQEHERARMIVPLMFSFSESESASNTNISIRVGTGLHGPPAKPQWCRPFPLQNGTRVRRLEVGISHSQPPVVYLVGIEIREGKGNHRDSKFVTVTPRFIIENQSSRRIQISQKNFATTFIDPAAEATHLTLLPECSLPFHWPRLDKDQLLCVRLMDVKDGAWSGGFPIENVFSFHINARDGIGNCYFLRVETVVEGSTFFVVFSDTDQLPPPFRVDNLSLVPILFHQSKVGDERLKLIVKPESSFPYAWDEPTQPSHITLTAPGGTSANVDMNALGLVAHLTYENFFYVAFVATFPRDEGEWLGVSGMETLQLVLDVPEGSKVVLRKKETGNRNQLWRMSADGLIEHEGSSPPRDPRKPAPQASLVLDVAGHAILPTQCVPLMLRKPDKRRACTQHWEFTEDGRLKCSAVSNMFVQAKDGFGVMYPSTKSTNPTPMVAAWQMWNEVVLGPPQPICYVTTNFGIPIEQAVARQKLRPGSGRLSVYVDTDGPTRVLRIVDAEKPPRSLLLCHTFEENSINTIPKMLFNLELQRGLGLNVISCNPREELLYILLSQLSVHWVDTEESETVNLSVGDLQIDNQLLESERHVAAYVTPQTDLEAGTVSPALFLRWKRLKSNLNAHLFKEWELSIKPLNLILEERLLLKIFRWFGLGVACESAEEVDDDGMDVQKPVKNSTSLTTKRLYFGQLKIVLNTVRLSVLTSSSLPEDLVQIKRRMGLTLVRFEETLVELDTFFKQHSFETFDFLTASLLKHFKDELLSQALLVLGSVDFLGNPVGFVNDLSVGVSTLIQDGSIEALVWNVTHGISNSAAKVTGSLGDGLTQTLTLDPKHEEWRRKIKYERGSTPVVAPLNAGIKGLSIGLYGGVTSIFSQTYDGVVNDGFTGLVSGLGKGLVGAVTKPAVGVLDLAAGVASAVRDSARSGRTLPKRIRPRRVVAGIGGLLPCYSEATAKEEELT